MTADFARDVRIAASAVRGSSWPGEMAHDMGQRADRLDALADMLDDIRSALRSMEPGGPLDFSAAEEGAWQWRQLPPAVRLWASTGDAPIVMSAPADKRDPECVQRWPECASGEYNPACCRFPKSCSCDVLGRTGQ